MPPDFSSSFFSSNNQAFRLSIVFIFFLKRRMQGMFLSSISSRWVVECECKFAWNQIYLLTYHSLVLVDTCTTSLRFIVA